jgi:hypothetical protein
VDNLLLVAFAQCQHEEIIFPIAFVDVVSKVSVKGQNNVFKN